MPRFFSSIAMRATDWRTPLYSHEPAFTSLAIRGLEDTTHTLNPARQRAFKGTGLKNRCLFVRGTFAASVGSRSAPGRRR
jgi:hypothetical protein